MELLSKLTWRYATKKFDASKKLNPEQLQSVLEAVNLAPTSYGLQPFKAIVIENKTLRKKLKDAAFGQEQVTDASQVIVFAAINNLSESHVDTFVRRISEVTQTPPEALNEYGGMMKNKVGSMDQEGLFSWASKQCYIALGFLLTGCASLKIDACPMEGFDPAQFDEILGLKEKNLNSVVMATIGFRSEEDNYQHHPKVRKKLDDLIVRV